MSQVKWKIKIYEDGPGRKFSITMFAVKEKGHLQIKNWFDEGVKAGSFPAMDSIAESQRLFTLEDLELVID